MKVFLHFLSAGWMCLVCPKYWVVLLTAGHTASPLLLTAVRTLLYNLRHYTICIFFIALY